MKQFYHNRPLICRREHGIYMALFMFSIIFTTCKPDGEIISVVNAIDILPPLVQSARVMDERRLQLEFDENINSGVEKAQIEPELTVSAVETDGHTLTLSLGEDQALGQNYVLRLEVEDDSGNRLSLLYSFTGYNSHVPKVLINEFNPLGTGKRPDCVELYVVDDGNIGGMLLTIGTEENSIGTFQFPAIEVHAGEYIVMHTKPEGLDEEVDEFGGMGVSGGLLATDGARDFWMKEAPGLPGTNGAIVLYRQRSGPIADAVLWSKQNDDPDDEKLGWTSKSYEWIKEIGQAKEWNASSGDIPFPSEAIRLEDSAENKLTGSKSFGRVSSTHDTNSAADWIISPTSGVTMGTANQAPESPESSDSTDSNTTDSGDTTGNGSETTDSGETGTTDTGDTTGNGSESTDSGETGTTDTGDTTGNGSDTSDSGETDGNPLLLINELNPEGSGNNPECVEIYVQVGGNLSGIVFIVGTEERIKSSYVFQSIEVMAGDYIVVHTRYEGTGDELDEIGAIDVSGGKLASDRARDFWLKDSPGLTSTNGAVTLYSKKNGKIVDAVLWSNRSDDPTDEKLGWTSESFIWAQSLGNANAWKASHGSIPLPSDAIAVTDSSATRSLNRKKDTPDSDSSADWYIVPNSGLTFGSVNNSEVYSK